MLLLSSFTPLIHAQEEPFAESTTFLVNTAQARTDSDNDGMPDSYEIAVGLNPFQNDASADPDRDGVSNIDEYNAGTSPTSPDNAEQSQGSSALFAVNTQILRRDTDADGIPDEWELAHGLNPLQNDAAADFDGDGLTNLQEYNSGTDPNSSDSPESSVALSAVFAANTATYAFSLTLDTDHDGIPDWWEQKYGLNALINDSLQDPDGDGKSNLAEYLAGSNPSQGESLAEVAGSSSAFTLNTRLPRIDSDGDGIPDAWEIAHGLDPFRNDALEDADHDGRANLEEYNAGTDPSVDDWQGPSLAASSLFVLDTGGLNISRARDTDGDGIPDWWEIQYGLDPNINDAAGDFDGDGISNLAEYNSGTNPRAADNPPVIGVSSIFLVDTGGRFLDSDGDGLPDWWEKLYFNDPRIGLSTADPDGDGASNYSEFLAGSNPLDPNSTLRITDLQAVYQTNLTTVTIRWVSFAGSTYSIWSATIPTGPYLLTASNVLASPPANIFVTTEVGTNLFYRISSFRQ